MKNSPEERRREGGFVVLAGWISFWLATACTILLAVIYIAVGDIPLWGAAITIFPPVVWFELAPLPADHIGPWDKPAMATCTVSAGDKTSRTVLFCDVILMLSPFATSLDQWFADSHRTGGEHDKRIEQYRNLAALLERKRKSMPEPAVILAGDFNIRGGSRSLNVLNQTGIRDIWAEGGRGWGTSILRDFPVRASTRSGWTAGRARFMRRRVRGTSLII